MPRKDKKLDMVERYLKNVAAQPRGPEVRREETSTGAIRTVTIVYESGAREIREYCGTLRIK